MLFRSRGSAVSPKPQALAPLVKDSVAMLRSTIPSSIELLTEITNGLPNVCVDAVQLQQLILNLCINARDAFESGHGKIRIALSISSGLSGYCSSCHQSVIGDFVELSVADNGSGINDTHHSKIFDPFFTTKEVGKGTGMGLSMVHGMVHEHGGHILLESCPDAGAKFRILFPISTEKDIPITTLRAVPSRKTGSGRIMIVDDDPVLAKYLGELLVDYGYQVTVLCDPIEALELFIKAPDAVDLVVTDQTMPDLSGHSLAVAMFDHCPDLPVVLCSGYSDTINEEKALAQNISAFLKKPIDPVELVTMLDTLLHPG